MIKCAAIYVRVSTDKQTVENHRIALYQATRPPKEAQRVLDDSRPMTAEQAASLKRLAEAAYELDAFKSNLTRAEADQRIAALAAKLKLLDGPPHTL